MTEPMLAVRNLRKRFPIRGGLFGRAKAYVDAVADVSFDVFPSQTLGLVGESGCGKSTTARAALRLIEPDSGSIMFDGRELMGMSHQDMRQVRKTAQIVFQVPYASLNPRWQINGTVGEGMVVHGFPKDEIADRVSRVAELADTLTSERASRRIGQRAQVLIEQAEAGTSAGRCGFQGPDDGETSLAQELPVGTLVDVVITGSNGVDLTAEAID